MTSIIQFLEVAGQNPAVDVSNDDAFRAMIATLDGSALQLAALSRRDSDAVRCHMGLAARAYILMGRTDDAPKEEEEREDESPAKELRQLAA